MTSPISATYLEIKSQAESWSTSLTETLRQSEPLTQYLHRPWAEVLFTGCGSTHYLSLAAAKSWQSLTGIQARAVPASELWLFPN